MCLCVLESWWLLILLLLSLTPLRQNRGLSVYQQKTRTRSECGRSGQLIELQLLRSSARNSGIGGTVVTTPLLQLASTPDDLAYWMSKFVLEVRLYSLVCCFKHYFEDNAVCDINLLNPWTHDSITLLLKFVYKN